MDDALQSYHSLDGLNLKGSFKAAPKDKDRNLVALFVHGITADRDEGGFYADIANELAERGIGSLRFDLRSHGASEGEMEDLTLFGGLSDISASRSLLHGLTDENARIVIVAASFGGGLAVLHAAKHPPTALVLLNPNLDYAANWLGRPDSKSLPSPLPAEMRDQLRVHKWAPRGEFRLSRAMINEVIHVRPADVMPTIACPALTVHGTKDSLVSYDIAQDSYRTAGPSEFLSIDGADHGFVVPGDETFKDPRTAEYRLDVVRRVLAWLDRFI